ncbi:MAG: PEGA domain-containing protein [Acidobacteriota bacterium]
MTKRIGLLAALLTIGLPLSAQQTGSLRVKTNSGRAGVFVDGRFLGPAANFGHVRTYQVAAGPHELTLREPRYEDLTMPITVTANSKTTIEPKMKEREAPRPPYGVLKVVGFKKYSPVYINDVFMGHADEFDLWRQGLLINPGEYDLRVMSPEGEKLLERKIKIVEKKTETVKK